MGLSSAASIPKRSRSLVRVALGIALCVNASETGKTELVYTTTMEDYQVLFDDGKDERFPVVLTGQSTLSVPSRSFARSHAAKWSKPEMKHRSDAREPCPLSAISPLTLYSQEQRQHRVCA